MSDYRIQRAAQHLRDMHFQLPPVRPNPAWRVIREHFGVKTFCWSDVSEDLPTEAELGSAFAALNGEAVLALLSLISRLLSDAHEHRNATEIQRSLADWMLPRVIAVEASRRLGAAGDEGRDAVFHQGQLLVASALALKYGLPGSPSLGIEPSEETRHQVGILLIQISAHFGLATGQLPESDAMLGITVRTAHIGSNEAQALLAARNYELLVERAASARATGTLTYDLERDFSDLYGTDPLGFMAIALLHVAPWGDARPFSTQPSGFWAAGQLPLAPLSEHTARKPLDCPATR
jgi:hypothetical protein